MKAEEPLPVFLVRRNWTKFPHLTLPTHFLLVPKRGDGCAVLPKSVSQDPLFPRSLKGQCSFVNPGAEPDDDTRRHWLAMQECRGYGVCSVPSFPVQSCPLCPLCADQYPCQMSPHPWIYHHIPMDQSIVLFLLLTGDVA